ncbi:MATE efflux family protein 3, chloroplastic [Hordeum vulgare]|nr:MATE efflux family protein 3, chloroplastic [Hordeum vulgare]
MSGASLAIFDAPAQTAVNGARSPSLSYPFTLSLQIRSSTLSLHSLPPLPVSDLGGGRHGVADSNVGGGDIVGGDGGSDGVRSFHEVDNWLGSSSYVTQDGSQQPEAPLVKSSPAPGCSMGCSVDEVVKMEIDSASEEDRPLELTALVKYVKNPGPTSICHNDVEHKENPDWFPEPDEFCFAGDLGISDEEEEDEVDLPYLLKKAKSNKKKMEDRHTCPSSAENTKVTTKWLAKAAEPSLRADPRAPADALIKNSKVNFSVDVSRSVAYRARRKAIKVVQGDQKEQYCRLRDYLQAVIDTNPGSRCIVTTFEDPENLAPTPRFKYMFYCLHASKQGFLNGCRPFIGLDGCFIKLTTGQQILAATGRDGNNNIYPIAFGVLDKEDGDSWNGS